MAIYKNREVGVISPMHTAQPPRTIIVQYNDGSHENVPLGLVKFTEDEKKALIKTYPSEFDNVEVTTEDDLKAVRLGITPPSDPELKRTAEAQVRGEKAQEENQKIMDKAKEEAKSKINKEVESKPTTPVVKPVATPVSTPKAK
jgi:hypothetical protein